VAPESNIELIPVQVTEKDKYVTRYKDFYMSGWNGDYILRGKRKYLDFLYQVGLGGKNAQGFGMFTIPERN
jgi:CRISPR-associated endoribonuclease Cas6